MPERELYDVYAEAVLQIVARSEVLLDIAEETKRPTLIEMSAALSMLADVQGVMAVCFAMWTKELAAQGKSIAYSFDPAEITKIAKDAFREKYESQTVHMKAQVEKAPQGDTQWPSQTPPKPNLN